MATALPKRARGVDRHGRELTGSASIPSRTDRAFADKKKVMSDFQNHITAFWTAVAANYDTHGGNVAEYATTAYQHWVKALAEALPEPPADILDVATGTGYVALAAASLGHHVTAIDLSASMLDELRTHAVDRDLTVDARLGDAVAPDFPPGQFDAVTSRHLLWTLREPEKAIANWSMLLRPGGSLLAVDGFWFAGSGEDDIPPLFAEHYTSATREGLPFMYLDQVEPIVDMVRAVGFVEVEAEPRPELALGSGVPYFLTAKRP
jgi:ubiquinone/menaquinone biosynthesis C-methylase UbiE